MKKLFAVLFVAAAFVFGAFAEDFPTGSWVDSNWNAEWVIDANSNITLKDSVTGATIVAFEKAQMQNYKFDVDVKDGATISFYYPSTGRAYKFNKPVTVSADLILTVDPDWQDTDYQVTIKFKSAKLF